MPFQYKDATISARELTIGENEDLTTLAGLARTSSDAPILIKHVRFAEFQFAAEVSGDGDFPIPRVTLDSPSVEVQASYQAWRGLPRSFGVKWAAELERAEANFE